MRTFALVCLSILLVVAAAFPLGDHSLESRDSAPAALVVRLHEESVAVPTTPGADDVLLPRIPSKSPVQPSGHFDHAMGSNQRGSGVMQPKWFQNVGYRRDLLSEGLLDRANYEAKDSTPSARPATIESSSSSSSATQRIAVSKEKNVDAADSANRWANQDYDWR
jgi:hypothetical protein